MRKGRVRQVSQTTHYTVHHNMEQTVGDSSGTFSPQ